MTRTKYTHTCPQCGEKFAPHREKQVCCSPKCRSIYRWRAAGNTVDCMCLHCGKPFTVRASFITKGGGKYCSMKCKADAGRTAETRLCIVCGKPFAAMPSMIARKYQTCSVECRTLRQRTEWESQRSTFTCEHCGKPFQLVRSDLAARSGRFCSLECYKAGGKRGEWSTCGMCAKPIYRHPAEIRNNTRRFCSLYCSNLAKCKPKQERRGTAHGLWRDAVLDRDGHTCQHCGGREDLNAHHIMRWRDYPNLRYAVENGIALCWRCHQIAHGKNPKLETFSPRRHSA